MSLEYALACGALAVALLFSAWRERAGNPRDVRLLATLGAGAGLAAAAVGL